MLWLPFHVRSQASPPWKSTNTNENSRRMESQKHDSRMVLQRPYRRENSIVEWESAYCPDWHRGRILMCLFLRRPRSTPCQTRARSTAPRSEERRVGKEKKLRVAGEE